MSNNKTMLTMYRLRFNAISIAITLILLFSQTLTHAQSYQSLWKKVDNAYSQSLPKTALQHIDKIIAKSQRDNNNPQLLKALITRINVAQDISEDSAKAMVPRVEAIAKAQTNETDKSLWYMTLGWLYAQQDSKATPERNQKISQALCLATTNPRLLASAKSQDYLPILLKGEDSRHYNNDMLSIVFPFVARQLRSLYTEQTDSLSRSVMAKEIDTYQTLGNRPATLLAKLDSAEIFGSSTDQFYKSVITQFGDQPLVTEAYARLASISTDSLAYALANEALSKYPSTSASNALRNIINRATQPTINVSINQRSIYPNDTLTLTLSHRNMQSATLSYSRLPYSSADNKLYELNKKDYDRLSLSPQYKTTIPLTQDSAFRFVSDSIALKAPSSGIYLVKLYGPNTEATYQILHVSSIDIIQLPLPNKKTRICVVDHKSGAPIARANIKVKSTAGNTSSWKDYTTDQRGELVLECLKSYYIELFAYTQGDKSLPGRPLAQSYDLRWNFNDSTTQVRLYTDRSIYRPGQTVKVGGFAYHQKGDSTHVLRSMPLNIELYNANHKLIESALLTTDEFGAFGTDFVLPKEALNGSFSIGCKYATTYFKVEEYKRPTFQITTQQSDKPYSLGDTIQIGGDVKTITGKPLTNTTVYCSTVRNRSRWFYAPDYESPITRRDTITTDSNGHFVLPITLSQSGSDNSAFKRLAYTYVVSLKATASDGETQETTMRIYASNAKAWINTNLPDVVCREQMPNIIATQTNAAGKTTEGKALAIVTQKSDTLYRETIAFDQPEQFGFLKNLPSGEYTLSIQVAEGQKKSDAYTKSFVVLSYADKHISGDTPLQIWSSNTIFTNDGAKARIIVASPLHDAWLHYDLVANEKVIDSQLIHLNDTIMHFDYSYSEAYGNGIHAQFAIYCNGTLYHKSQTIAKPTPDKTLKIRWSTFRNKLTPGAEETWTMQITKDSVPVKASVLATMYDASLNKFGTHSLPFSVSFDRTIPLQRWRSYHYFGFMISSQSDLKQLKETPLAFSALNPDLFNIYQPSFVTFRNGKTLRASRHTRMAKSYTMSNMVFKEAELSPALSATKAEDTAEAADEAMGGSAPETDDDAFDQIKLRTDFSETAFFASSLKTDSKGEARIEFKLPESLTSWDFHAIAHTAQLDYGILDTTVIVEKPFELHANTPRFLRNSDKTTLAIGLTNNTNSEQKGKVRLVLTDAMTGKEILRLTKPFNLGANKNSAVNFDFTIPSGTSLMICHTAAMTQDFSDAEQQYIPVLPNMHRQITTVPFVLSDSLTHTISLDNLHYNNRSQNASLTFEYTSNPIWTLLSAMPTTVGHTSPNATTLASNLASLSIVGSLLNHFPQLKTVAESWKESDTQTDSPLTALENNSEVKNIVLAETPWELDAQNERQRLMSLCQSASELNLKQQSMIDKLKELQRPDGGWCWFPGMPSNQWLTLQIAQTLLQVKDNITDYDSQLSPMVDKAINYMEKCLKKDVDRMRRDNISIIPTTWTEHLYVLTLAKRTDSDEYKYLVGLLRKAPANYDLYQKALTACIMQSAGYKKEAHSLANSLIEHTVSTPSMGRYFDSDKAPSSWSMYRIPTQLRAIEAITQIYPDSTKLLSQMKQWLLMSKHTQTWNNPLISAQAIQTLLGAYSPDTTASLPSTIVLTTKSGKAINLYDYVSLKAPYSLGYLKANIPMNLIGDAPHHISLSSPSEQIAYGAAYLTGWLPTSEVKSSGSELQITTKLYVETPNGWRPLTAQTILHKGDRIKALHQIEAKRDLDFVAVKANRAACMEPASTTSGYQGECYHSVEDASTSWFYDKLAKGTHSVEEVFNIDRIGTYAIAPSQAQCQYAPEITSTTNSTTINVK